jgi:ATP-dependent DNA helicase DinG
MLPDHLKEEIQFYYTQYLQSRGLQARYGQKLMIAEIAKSLAQIQLEDHSGEKLTQPPICVIEAGTGTGKTIAYLIAALPIARALGKQLVIATATVALQEQLLFKDIPELQANTDLTFSTSLAKGRGRYVCLSRLDNLLKENASEGAMQELFGIEIDSEQSIDKALYQRMQEALTERRWQGERDDWPEQLDNLQWRAVSVEPRQCSGSRCSQFKDCVFFKARQKIQQSECIVANQDLVLADLNLGGGAILPHPADTIYIFDEAHHLPQKGVSHFSNSLSLRQSLRWLDQARRLLVSLQNQADKAYQDLLEKADAAVLELRQKVQENLLMFEQLESAAKHAAGQQSQYTFPYGRLTPELREATGILYLSFSQLSQILDKLLSKLRQDMEEQGETEAQQAESWYAALGLMQSRCDVGLNLCLGFSREDEPQAYPHARWLSFEKIQDELELTLSCSPILAAENLSEKLWDECLGAVLTSATLSALDSFDFLIMRSGLHNNSSLCRIGSPFNFSEAGLLRLPESGFDAGDSDAHTRAIIRYLPQILKDDKGALVLFSSRRQMQDVLYQLDKTFRQIVICQDDYSKHSLLNKHRERIDAGEPSVIFGLASLSEGVDLPGDYCTHVVIAKLPFAVPDNPVDLTLGEWIRAQGLNPFQELAIPDAAMKLVQASGRLLRNEADRGTITILDDRLLTRSYGVAILNSLPPYRREIFSP